ncbi:hypothetical protein HY251_20975 [bacterium]|nr:hypothetical protein [bacterium]
MTGRPIDPGQVDPEFAKFRQKKLSERLERRVAPPPKEALETHPELEKGMFFGKAPWEKKKGEDEAKSGSVNLKDLDLEAVRPADAPPQVGQSVRLIDIALGQAPPVTPGNPMLAAKQKPHRPQAGSLGASRPGAKPTPKPHAPYSAKPTPRPTTPAAPPAITLRSPPQVGPSSMVFKDTAQSAILPAMPKPGSPVPYKPRVPEASRPASETPKPPPAPAHRTPPKQEPVSQTASGRVVAIRPEDMRSRPREASPKPGRTTTRRGQRGR